MRFYSNNFMCRDNFDNSLLLNIYLIFQYLNYLFSISDELLLVESYTPPPKELPTPDSFRGPTPHQINNITHNLAEKNATRKYPQAECAADVSF